MFLSYLILLFFCSSNFGVVLALPLPSDRTSLEPSQAQSPANTNANLKRTSFNVIWNCLSTTIICAWVSVHPNVPPSGHWRALRRGLKTMIWTIIAPELVLAWAVRQWFAAREIRDTVNGTSEGLLTGLVMTVKEWFAKEDMTALNKWTMRHGHLLEMGGITTVDPTFEKDDLKNPRGQVLTFDRYRQLSTNDESFKLPKITEADISDKSKGDFLSKLVAILQTTWFLLQCIARGQQKLAITELELVTLALASLNAITYAFWWNKPLGVQEPIRIYFKTEANLKAEEQLPGARDETLEVTAYYVLSQVGKHLKDIANEIFKFALDPCEDGICDALIILVIVTPFLLVNFLSLCILLPFPLGVILLLKILKTTPVTEDLSDRRGLIAARIVQSLSKLRYRLTSYIAMVSEDQLRKFLDDPSRFSCTGFIGWVFLIPALFFILLATTVCLLPLFTLTFLVSFIFTAVFGIITSNVVAPGATHVPSFYAPPTKSDKYSRMVVFALFGVLFGGLHCIGWNFQYPTQFEQQLWRATSLAITVIPFIVAPIDYILENFELSKGFGKAIRLFLDLIMTILLFVYVPARLSLIAQALALMRHQPQDAYLAVDWTQYIPHIF